MKLLSVVNDLAKKGSWSSLDPWRLVKAFLGKPKV